MSKRLLQEIKGTWVLENFGVTNVCTHQTLGLIILILSRNFLESKAYIITRITVSRQTPEDVVNKQRNISNLSIQK